jgi:hypothetical protein
MKERLLEFLRNDQAMIGRSDQFLEQLAEDLLADIIRALESTVLIKSNLVN